MACGGKIFLEKFSNFRKNFFSFYFISFNFFMLFMLLLLKTIKNSRNFQGFALIRAVLFNFDLFQLTSTIETFN